MNLSISNAEIQLDWYCQFDGVKAIAVQRSTDSVRNFNTIALLTKPKKGNLSYRDLHPLAGKNYYRLSVEFGNELEWFSNTYKAMIDSATLAQAVEEKNRMAEKIAQELSKPAVVAPTEKAVKPVKPAPEVKTDIPASPPPFSFTPSDKIHTDPFSGHIRIELGDALSKHYTIRFYDPSQNEILRVSRVSKPVLILDKNNFNSKGIYSFKLFDNNVLVESGYITIF